MRNQIKILAKITKGTVTEDSAPNYTFMYKNYTLAYFINGR